MKLVHFVGVTPDQYPHAVKVWGHPAFTHGRATWSVIGEIDGDDVVILGRDAFSTPRKWAPRKHGKEKVNG